MENELLCNFKKCRKALNSQAWITSCSHIFCNDDGAREFEKASVCPACDTPLPGKYDVVRADLNPSEQYKSMVLAGQKPEVILDVCTRAITFWTYQVHQEIVYQEYISNKSKEKQSQLEKYYENVLQKLKNERDQTQHKLSGKERELEAAQAKNAELAEKLLERNRQYQKLQCLYETLRRKFISPSFFERQVTAEKKRDRGNVFEITTASDVLSRQKSARAGEKVAETDFVLRPVPTPTPTAQSHPFDFQPIASPARRGNLL